MNIDQSNNQFFHLSPPVAVHVEKDECDMRTTEFFLAFTTDGSGYSFDCLSDGTVIESRLNECSRKSYDLALSEEWERVQVRTHTVRERLCMCGSGKPSTRQYDARSIYLTSTCQSCHKEKMSGYRTEVLTNSNYDCDEQIEADY